MIMLKHFIIQFTLYYPSGGHSRQIKNIANIKLLALKVVEVTYRRFQMQLFDWETWYFEKLVTAKGSTVAISVKLQHLITYWEI